MVQISTLLLLLIIIHTGLWCRTGFVTVAQVFRFLNAQVSKKNGRKQTIIGGKKHFLHLFYCCSVNLNAVSCLTEDVIHHRFRLQQNNLTKTKYRKIDLNRSWTVKADSHVFLFCIGRAEIKQVLVGVLAFKL